MSLSPTKSTRKRLRYGSGSEEVWSEHIEAIFVDGLRAYWDSPRATYSGRGRSRWRNQYLVDYLQGKGITRSKKQVASHLQILRHTWKGKPEYHLFAGIDEQLNQPSHPENDSPSAASNYSGNENPDDSPSVALHRTKLQDKITELTSTIRLAQAEKSVHSNPSPPMPDTPSLSYPNTPFACRDCSTTSSSSFFQYATRPENSRPEPENERSESIQTQHEHRDTPSEIYHNETLHTDSHNTTTTTNANSHNVNITNVHHHHHEPKQRRWSITKFVHQITTIFVPVFWYPHSITHHVPHWSFGGVNGWWEWIWTHCGWQCGWRWGG
ncbi:hypothetical protein PQX77_012008 [Marasmius sp. AFHP31]|nr:hypothetical protein PQX77_012008 [Marasmius sp. AFHP31]